MTAPTPLRIGSTETAAYLGVSVRELKRLRQARRIPFYRLGHRTVSYAIADLDAFLNQCRIPAREG